MIPYLTTPEAWRLWHAIEKKIWSRVNMVYGSSEAEMFAIRVIGKYR